MTLTPSNEIRKNSINEVAPNAPKTATLLKTFDPDTLHEQVHDDIFAPMSVDWIQENRKYFDQFVGPYLPADQYESFLNSAHDHRTFNYPHIDFEEILNYLETNNKERGEFTSLNTARLEFVSGIHNAFIAGKWQSFLEPNFLKKLTEHIPKCHIMSGESYPPDLVLTDFFATLRLLTSKIFTGTPEEKQSFVTEGFNIQSLAVLNHWVPSCEQASQHIGQLTLNYLSSEQYVDLFSTLGSLDNPDQVKDPKTRRDLVEAHYCLNALSMLLSNNSQKLEMIHANNTEVIHQSWSLIDKYRTPPITEELLAGGKEALTNWLSILRQKLPMFMPELIATWKEVGVMTDPKMGEGEVEAYYKFLIEEHRRGWQKEQIELIRYIEDDTSVDKKVLLRKISDLIGVELSCLESTSPSQARVDYLFSQLFQSINSENVVLSSIDPSRRVLIYRPDLTGLGSEYNCEEWVFCEGSFKNSFQLNRVDGLYGPITTLTEQQYAQFLKLMRAVSAYYPVVLEKQTKDFIRNLRNPPDEGTSGVPPVNTTPPPEYYHTDTQ